MINLFALLFINQLVLAMVGGIDYSEVNLGILFSFPFGQKMKFFDEVKNLSMRRPKRDHRKK